MMNILFDIDHPVHFHLFRNFIHYLKAHDHQIFIVTRNKDVTYYIVPKYNIIGAAILLLHHFEIVTPSLK